MGNTTWSAGLELPCSKYKNQLKKGCTRVHPEIYEQKQLLTSEDFDGIAGVPTLPPLVSFTYFLISLKGSGLMSSLTRP